MRGFEQLWRIADDITVVGCGELETLEMLTEVTVKIEAAQAVIAWIGMTKAVASGFQQYLGDRKSVV